MSYPAVAVWLFLLALAVTRTGCGVKKTLSRFLRSHIYRLDSDGMHCSALTIVFCWWLATLK